MVAHFEAAFGQRLCDALAAEIGYVCSFMGDGGVIVASSELQRIGSIHRIAARIMRGEIAEYRVSAEEQAKSLTMREGINLGIDVEGRRLICFSIVGPLAVVCPLALLMRFCVTSLLQVRQDEVLATPAALQAAPPVTCTADLGSMLSKASETFEHNLSRLRATLDNMDQGITMFDSALRLVVWNKRYIELINIPADLITFGVSFETILRFNAEHGKYGPGDAEQQIAERMALVARNEHHVFERTQPDGTVLEIRRNPLATGGFVTTYRDITRHRQAEIALRAAYENAEQKVEARTRDLRDFAELSADWFWEQDAEFRFTQFSGLSIEKLQRKQSDFFGKRRWEMPISGVSNQALAEHIRTCERHETFRDFEYEIPSTDGTIQYYSISGMPMFDKQGVFLGYHGNGRNTTALRLAEQAVKNNERLLSQIVDGSPIATFVLDAQRHVTHWNKACANLTGFDANQMLAGSDVWRAFYSAPRPTMADMVISGADDKIIGEHYAKFNRSNLISGAIESEHFFPQMGNHGRWLYFTAAPLRDSQGKITGAVETLQDITERHRDQVLLEQQTAALQSAYADMEARVVERTAELSRQLNFQQQLIEAIPGPVFYKDEQARYLGCNSAFEAFIGRSSSELIGKTVRELFSGDLANAHFATDRAILDQPGSQVYEAQITDANNQTHEVMFHKATFTQPDGSVGGLVGLMLDISERKKMEDNLRQAATVFDNSAEGVIISMPDYSIIAVNRAFTEITGYSEAEVIGCNPSILQSGLHDDTFFQEMHKRLAHQGRWQGEIWNRRKNGEIYPQSLSISAVRDKLGKLTNYVATFADITHQKQAEERIQLLAFSDPLTNLPNRRLLLDRLEHSLVSCLRSKRFGALFFIDLDDFKALNDTRGHHIGDILLKQVAQRLSACVREGDTVARLGGDEFVVMLEDLSDDVLAATNQAESVGSKILKALNQTYILQDSPHHSTPSIGVTLFGELQSSLEDLLKQADLAMYQAKSSGRNTMRFFDPEMQASVAARVTMKSELLTGLQENQFMLYYQPQVDANNIIVGAEALIRWQHPQRGMVPPAEFIPLTEETGLIVKLGKWVLETACAQLKRWAVCPQTAHLTMAVNVSAHQFRQQGFVDELQALLSREAIGPGKLKMELTESLLLNDVEDTIAKMIALKASGVCFSLDDFGTGYSSLSYLKRLPLDQLKIDQSFVRDILSSPNAATIAQTIVTLAHSLGLNVIAEGVESKEQHRVLFSQGCRAYQGYLFSRPLPIESFETLLLQTRLSD
ncbi:MAG: EAL domain-containing protein [Rhodocyclaceae bacterium]|nr:EAL domain-containing protein [Rhodocyclaceae bacterium]